MWLHGVLLCSFFRFNYFKMKQKHVLLALSLSVCGLLSAQETQKVEALDSVFLDSKVVQPRKNSGKVVTKITKETIENNVGKSVAQLLNEVSGIEINGSRGNAGSNLGYYVRGGRNRQVVIMIDGVALQDASQIASDYDLRLVPVSSIESIEIIKGASSVLYGSGAATAVINIETKKADKAPISLTVTSSMGTNKSTEDEDADIEDFSNYVALSGTLNKFFYNVSFSNTYTNGLSSIAAPEDAPTNFESDIFNRIDGKVDLGYNFSDNVSFHQFFTFDKYKAGFDDFGFFDADNTTYSKQIRTGGQLLWKYNKGRFVLNESFNFTDREVDSSFPTQFDARSIAFDTYGTYEFSETFTALLGFNGNFNSFNSFAIPFGGTDFEQTVSDDVASAQLLDPYVTLLYNSDFGLHVNSGARLNNHDTYGTHLVYNINPSYVFSISDSDLKVLGSYSTAYITPSLFQLFDPLYGNEDLTPEENTTIEGGLEFTSASNFRISALYFTRNEKDFIDFVLVDPDTFSYQYQNVSEEFTASGVEVEVAKRFENSLSITANYTYTSTDEKFALRIPEHKANVTIGYNPLQSLYLGLAYQFTGERDDTFFNSNTFENETVTLDSFSLLDFNVNYQVTKNIKLFASVTNILDEEYEEIYRYQTLGRNVRGGFTLSF